jgi:hypothetical protein
MKLEWVDAAHGSTFEELVKCLERGPIVGAHNLNAQRALGAVKNRLQAFRRIGTSDRKTNLLITDSNEPLTWGDVDRVRFCKLGQPKEDGA